MKLYGWAVTYLLLWYGGQQIEAWLPSSAATADSTIRRRHQQHQHNHIIERHGRSTSRQTTASYSSSSSSSTDNDEVQQDEQQQQLQQKTIQPDILKPFFPAADPRYMCDGPVGHGDFVVRRDGPPLAAELTNENLLKIVRIECSDLEVNTLVWKCMGYRFSDDKEWTSDECFPNWRERFPQPPDFIGMQRIYSPEIDKPSLKANQALVKSIPLDNKQSLKEHLKPYGFKGYQYAELTPNKTRRAQCANWLIYYREELFGYTLEELRERKRLRLEQQAQQEREMGTTQGEWKPPVTEVV